MSWTLKLDVEKKQSRGGYLSQLEISQKRKNYIKPAPKVLFTCLPETTETQEEHVQANLPEASERYWSFQ